MRINSALSIDVTKSEVTHRSGRLYRLLDECAERALSEIGPTISGTPCKIMREDGTVTLGVLKYHPEIDPDEVLLEVESRNHVVAA